MALAALPGFKPLSQVSEANTPTRNGAGTSLQALPGFAPVDINAQPEASLTDEPPTAPGQPSTWQPALDTVRNVAKVYPAAEAAAATATASYGVPLSGLAGLLTTAAGLDLDTANKVVNTVQDYLIYKPQSEGGQQLMDALGAPQQAVNSVGRAAGKSLEEAGYPMAGAAVHSAVSSAPAIIGGATALGRTRGTSVAAIDAQMSKAVRAGTLKAIKPGRVSRKLSKSQMQKQLHQYDSAVKQILQKRDALKLTDEQGRAVKGLPETVDQFAQGIEQAKKLVYEEYDQLRKQAGKKGASVNLINVADELNPIITSKALQDFSRDTVNYAKRQQRVLRERNHYNIATAQEVVQMANQTLDAYYKNPTPAMRGKVMVDALIANRIRKILGDNIEEATGSKYSAIKKQYGDLAAVEKDVANRAFTVSKATKPIHDIFANLATGHAVVKGLIAMDPATVAGGLAVKGLSKYIQLRRNPNRLIKLMFADVDKLARQRQRALLK